MQNPAKGHPPSGRYTILGASGYIGSQLTRYLEQRGIEFWAPKRGVDDIYTHDLGRVIYCVGYTQDFLSDPINTAEAHVCYLSSLLRRANFSSLVYLSSVRLYDGLSGRVDESSNLIVNPNRPRHLFDLTKLAAESLCMNLPGRNLTVARLSSVYDDKLIAPNFIHSVIRRALSESSFTVDTASQDVRDYIFIDDACQALVELAVGASSGIYNVASGIAVTNLKLFELIGRHTGAAIHASDKSPPSNAPLVDITRLRETTTVNPRPIEQVLPDIIRMQRGRQPT